MIKAILIDDEKFSIETLLWKIENYTPNIFVEATFTDPQEGLAYLKKNKIDLLFLDIEMPLLSGFELLQKIMPLDFDVIFTTAYDAYAIKAIKYSALDYLLKPVQEDELKAAVAKHQGKNNHQLLSPQLEVLLQNMNKENLEKRRIALATKESIELVYPKDIVLCKSENNYTYVYIEGKKKKLISKTLKDFEEILQDHSFFRTHQSYLINTQHIMEYVRKEGGYILMSNEIQVPVSRNKKEELMQFF